MRRSVIVTALFLLVSATPAEAQWRVAPDIDIGAAGRAAAVAVGDFDNDGRHDLAIADSVSGRHFIHVRLGNGDGSFREGSRFSSALVLFPDDLAVGDFDANGNEDLGVAAGGATLALTRVTIALAARRAPLRVRVVNANAFAVTGRLAAHRFTVAAGGRTTVKLPLRKAQRRRLARKGRVAAAGRGGRRSGRQPPRGREPGPLAPPPMS